MRYITRDSRRGANGIPFFVRDLICVLFAIGYKFNLVFDNVPDGRIFDGYAMAALFCGLSILSGFMNMYRLMKYGAAIVKASTQS